MPTLRHTLAIPLVNTIPEVLVSIATHKSGAGIEKDVRLPGWEFAGDFELSM